MTTENTVTFASGSITLNTVENDHAQSIDVQKTPTGHTITVTGTAAYIAQAQAILTALSRMFGLLQ
jgi:hypothetical protein